MRVYVPSAAQCPLVTVYDSSIKGFVEHNSGGRIDWVLDPSDAEVIVIFEEWESRFWQYANTLSGIGLLRTHWDRVFTINCDDLGRGHLPGLYTSLNTGNFDPAIHRACAYPYLYNNIAVDPAASLTRTPRWLFSFRGTDVSHSCRGRIFKLYSDHPLAKLVLVRTKFHGHSDEQKLAYIDDILDSKFVLCPRGWSPATYRMFEVMELGRCPVIISDAWVPIRDVPWPKFSIVVAESEIPRLDAILAAREHEAQALGQAARAAWERHFSDTSKFKSMMHSILELREQPRASFDAFQRRWSSWRFLQSNQWLPHQRMSMRIGKELNRVSQLIRQHTGR